MDNGPAAAAAVAAPAPALASALAPALAPQVATQAASRPLNAMVFVKDPDSQGVIRQALEVVGLRDMEVVSGTVARAITDLARKASPRLLFVDVSGIDDAASKLVELSEVCEPGTAVIVVGDKNDIALYRQVRSTGIAEYFFKPLISSHVASVCEAILNKRSDQPGPRLGKLIFTLGVGGGAGATTIATNAAWHLAERMQRQVAILDLNITDGDAALQLNVQPTGALAEALEHPERIDDLFLERAAIRVTERLRLLATLQPLSGTMIPSEQTVVLLVQGLLRRYRYVVVDMPPTFARHLSGALHLPGTVLLVSNGSLLAARDVPRWRELLGPSTPDRSVMHVLNKARGPDSVPMADFGAAIGQQPEIVIPYDSHLGRASVMGIGEAQNCSQFQHALRPLFRRLSGEKEAEATSIFSRLLQQVS